METLSRGEPRVQLVEDSLTKSIEYLGEFPSCTAYFFQVLGHTQFDLEKEREVLRERIPLYCAQFPSYMGIIFSLLQTHHMRSSELASALAEGLKNCSWLQAVEIMGLVGGKNRNPDFLRQLFEEVERQCPEHCSLILRTRDEVNLNR